MSSRVVAAAVGIVVALALQATVFSRLPLPGDQPNLLLVLVVAAALAGGPAVGIGMGFVTGLLADLLSNHPIGLLALIFMLVGWLVGRVDAPGGRGVFWSSVLVALATIGSVLGYLLVLTLVGTGGVEWGSHLTGLAGTVIYDVMLTPFMVPLVAAIERRLRPRGRA